MFKIITTKRYKDLEMASFMLDITEEIIDIQDKEIKELKDLRDDVKKDTDSLIKIIEKWDIQAEKECFGITMKELDEALEERARKENTVKVYKLNWTLDKKKGVAFKGTKKELDKFINKNIKKDVKKSK
jgi:ribosomal protein L4